MAAVTARIGTIEARIASLAGAGAQTAQTSSSARTAGTAPLGSFADAMAAAARTPGATAPGTPAGAPGSGGAAGALAALMGGTSASMVSAAALAARAGAGAAAPVAGAGARAHVHDHAHAPAAPAAAPAAAKPAATTAADLARWGNGRIPPEALTSIGGKERLWAPAAEAFTRMRAAAKADGVSFGVNDSYRSFDEQVDMVRRKGLYSQGGLAAKPGTSDHGWGKAVDLQLDSRAQSWMRTNAERFGFVEDTPREPWHWGFKA